MKNSCISKKSIGLIAALIFIISAVICFPVSAEFNENSNCEVRVGLNYASASNSSVTIDISSGGFKVFTESTADLPVNIDVNSLTLSVDEGKVNVCTVFGAVVVSADFNEKVTVLPADNSELIAYNGSNYYGCFEFYANNNGKITVINVTNLEDYLKGVLPSEVYTSWNLEALKAAAVVSRTYAIKSITASSHSSSGFDICATTHCQMYSGSNKENERTNEAILETESLILMYDGTIATTPYHSSTGGYTESASGAWGGNPEKFPYLTNVFNPYEDYRNIPNGKWLSIISPLELFEYIPESYKAKLQLGDLSFDYNRNGTGFIGNMTVTDVNGTSLSFKTSGSVRSFFGSLVKSANFGITKTYIPSEIAFNPVTVITSSSSYETTGIGGVDYITADGIKTTSGFEEVYAIDGQGYGHGVGMSQFGAKAMADAGFTFEKILETYYPGTDLVSFNGLT